MLFCAATVSSGISRRSTKITWAAGDDNSSSGRIHIYDTSTGETHMVTDSMFNDNAPAFDRKGEWLYFTSNRNFNPSYSELDTTWIYNNSGVLMAVPLRGDIDYPWLEESDEEEWTDEEPEEEDSEDEEESEDGEDTDAIDPDDPVTGTWECTAEVPQMGEVQMTVTLVLNDDDLVTGTLSSDVFTGELNGVWNAEDSVSVDEAGGAGADRIFNLRRARNAVNLDLSVRIYFKITASIFWITYQ